MVTKKKLLELQDLRELKIIHEYPGWTEEQIEKISEKICEDKFASHMHTINSMIQSSAHTPQRSAEKNTRVVHNVQQPQPQTPQLTQPDKIQIFSYLRGTMCKVRRMERKYQRFVKMGTDAYEDLKHR